MGEHVCIELHLLTLTSSIWDCNLWNVAKQPSTVYHVPPHFEQVWLCHFLAFFYFRSLTVATKPQHYHWQKRLPFLLSSWQHFAAILRLSQSPCWKSTMWFFSWRMRRHFLPVKYNRSISFPESALLCPAEWATRTSGVIRLPVTGLLVLSHLRNREPIKAIN